jgi:hypothetical protein
VNRPPYAKEIRALRAEAVSDRDSATRDLCDLALDDDADGAGDAAEECGRLIVARRAADAAECRGDYERDQRKDAEFDDRGDERGEHFFPEDFDY